jgi:hypothetical protein
LLDDAIARSGKRWLTIDAQQYAAGDKAQGFHGDGDVEFVCVENQFTRLTKAFIASRMARPS